MKNIYFRSVYVILLFIQIKCALTINDTTSESYLNFLYNYVPTDISHATNKVSNVVGLYQLVDYVRGKINTLMNWQAKEDLTLEEKEETKEKIKKLIKVENTLKKELNKSLTKIKTIPDTGSSKAVYVILTIFIICIVIFFSGLISRKYIQRKLYIYKRSQFYKMNNEPNYDINMDEANNLMNI
ncbi:hypothetical protein A3Q56_00157 [Intoshia linei]|uniref:Uncharacterized protein n=1 Tax=Intoshia linei TaxID=1819745 RepID=A0A177BD06_9BILA|nr:hypothetical protein A3Q56_00157 [Intoshia linei]